MNTKELKQYLKDHLVPSKLYKIGKERDGRICLTKNKEFWEVYINGGRTPTGFQAVEWAQRVEELGAGEITLTSMDADGTHNGYDLEITRAVRDVVRIPIIASGGAGCPQHMVDAVKQARVDAVLAAGMFHFGQYTIKETKQYLQEQGVPVRI